jgi:hypothetical protein
LRARVRPMIERQRNSPLYSGPLPELTPLPNAYPCPASTRIGVYSAVLVTVYGE